MAAYDQAVDRVGTSLVELDEDGTKRSVAEAIEAGAPAIEILTGGLSRGMAVVGERFEASDYFLPELLVASEIFKMAVETLRPMLATGVLGQSGTVVIGTVQGDIHDIGKNIVKLMLETRGFDVIDLGIDVAPAEFLEAQASSEAEIIAASALISSTVPHLQVLIREVRAVRPGVAIMIGGAPVTAALASHYGADGYAPDANGAVNVALDLVARAGRAESGGGRVQETSRT